MFGPGEKKRLLDFVGYGRLDASVWFLGMEEAGGGEDLLRVRAGFRQVEDLYEAHKALGITKHHEGRQVIQPQWGRMSDLVLRLSGNQLPTLVDRRHYQASRLGRTNGDTLIAELMPIPKPTIDIWDYPNAFPEFATAADYYASVRPGRIALLSGLIATHCPTVIVAYGSAYKPHYAELMPNGRPAYIDGFDIVESGVTLMVMTPFLSSIRMNGRIPALAELIIVRTDLFPLTISG